MSHRLFYSLVAIFIVASTIFWYYMFQDDSYTIPFLEEQTETVRADGITLTMYHSPTCGCCKNWATYLEDHGAEVISEETMNVYGVKQENGVPYELSSCHTAIVDGYVIEGHVPVEDIVRLLEEKPDAIGLSVPGMPVNSPGMDMPSDEEYQTVLFDADNVEVYNTHN